MTGAANGRSGRSLLDDDRTDTGDFMRKRSARNRLLVVTISVISFGLMTPAASADNDGNPYGFRCNEYDNSYDSDIFCYSRKKMKGWGEYDFVVGQISACDKSFDRRSVTTHIQYYVNGEKRHRSVTDKNGASKGCSYRDNVPAARGRSYTWVCVSGLGCSDKLRNRT